LYKIIVVPTSVKGVGIPFHQLWPQAANVQHARVCAGKSGANPYTLQAWYVVGSIVNLAQKPRKSVQIVDKICFGGIICGERVKAAQIRTNLRRPCKLRKLQAKGKTK
jgi:hypothetical protein